MSTVPILIKTINEKRENQKDFKDFEQLVEQSLLIELKNNGLIDSTDFYEALNLMSEKEKSQYNKCRRP